MDATVAIAQITDTHLRLPGELACGVDTGRRLRDVVTAILGAPFSIDAILATGDLADRGRHGEYAYFRELVQPIRAPLFPLPGNHDDPRALASAFRDKIDLPPAGDAAYAAEVGALRIVMLDSTVAGAEHGIVSDGQLRWLDRTLASRPRQPTLVAMHHPPFRTGIRAIDDINCRNGHALAELIARHDQVLALSCGHVHRSILASFAGRPASVAPSPAYAAALELAEQAVARFHVEVPALHVHLWSPDGGRYGRLITHFLPVPSMPVSEAR